MRSRIRNRLIQIIFLVFGLGYVLLIDEILKATVFSEEGSLLKGSHPVGVFVAALSVTFTGFILLFLMRDQYDDKRLAKEQSTVEPIDLEHVKMSAVVGGQIGLLVVGAVLWTLQSGGIDAALAGLFRMERPFVAGALTVLTAALLIAFNFILDIIARRHFPMRWWWDETFFLFLRFSYGHLLLFLLLVAMSEEILFRGVVLPFITELVHSPLVGLVLASYLFAVVHVQYDRKPVLQVAVFFFGIVLSLLYMYTGTIWSAILAHFLYDFILLASFKRWPVLYEKDASRFAELEKMEKQDTKKGTGYDTEHGAEHVKDHDGGYEAVHESGYDADHDGGLDSVDDTRFGAWNDTGYGVKLDAVEYERRLEQMIRVKWRMRMYHLVRVLTVIAFGISIGIFLFILLYE